jgi:bacteriocin-like protein
MPSKQPGTDKKPAAGNKMTGSPDNLVKNGKNAIELTEDDLKNVSGGVKLDYKE